ncbi:ATP-binding protein [Streptomyces sp. NPDC048643]|uniref:sensor histidine kinase n=1 Tax=Streptomyces sp. NPDC048643 TaxID=3155637 RepID=UPI00343990A8
MSHLRAPAARADRREGGRHGRPVARATPSPPETHLRPQLLRLAVLPPTAVALSACAAVLFTVRSTGARPGPALWAVLAGAVAVAMAGILIAAVAADRAALSVGERTGALRRASARAEADLHTVVEGLRRGETPPARTSRRQPPVDADDFELLAADMSRAHDGAVAAVVQAARLSGHTGSEQTVEVFVNLARRLQSLVHREISILDELENEIEDPDLLKGLFHVDHLATRIRRHAENLAVLGGAVSRRQWSNPVSMTEVLRSAIAEVEQYSRVKLVPPIDGTVRGHAVADVIHLLAELVENATVFSAPHTQVLLRVNLVTSGLAIEVEDRGLGMQPGEQHKMNTLLADPDQVNVAGLLQDGRIGLFVVSQLARRHGIHVRLQSNIYGGVQAVLVVPQELLGSAPGVLGDATGRRETGGGQLPPGGPQPPHAGQVSVAPAGRQVAPVPRQAQRELTPGETPPRVPPRGQAPGHASGPVPSGGPAPLPSRATRAGRPNPADAVPGIRPADRIAAAENAGMPPTPRTGAVRGTMGRPHLPKRRAQEHLVPQLREGPTPRQDSEEVVGHDPGLMAAFQRGIGRAEAAHARAAGGPGAPLGPAEEAPTGPSAAPVGGPLDLLRADLLPPNGVGPGLPRRPGTDHPGGGLPGGGLPEQDRGMRNPGERAPTAPHHLDDFSVGHGEPGRDDLRHGELGNGALGNGALGRDGVSPVGTGPDDPAPLAPGGPLPYRPRPEALRTDGAGPADGTPSPGVLSDGTDFVGVPPTNGTPTPYTGDAHTTTYAPSSHENRDTAPGHDRTGRHDGSAPAG